MQTSSSAHKKQREHGLFFKKFNSFLLPGLYCIINKKTKRRYIGETGNLANHCSEHYTMLKGNKHECKELQKDWNRLGEKSFDFYVLKSNISYTDRVIRLNLQRQLIQKYKLNCYNLLGKVELKKVEKAFTQLHNSVPVLVYGNTYTSISAAAQTYNIGLSVAKNRLNKPLDNNWEYLDSSRRAVSNVARPVVVDSTYYPSVNTAAAGNNVTEKTVRKYIRELPNWRYFDTLTLEEQKQIISMDSQSFSAGSFRHGRRVKVGNQIYDSIIKTGEAYNICSKSVRKRIDSKYFPDWSWAD